MYHQYFFHNSIRRYVVVFGTIFNDITVRRLDSSSSVVNSVKVPIAYGSRQKWLARINQDPSLNKKTQIDLPRLSFNMSGALQYDSTRKLATSGYHVNAYGSDANQLTKMRNPAPYNIPFELNIYTLTDNDMHQIIEQIIPFFSPSFIIPVKMVYSDLGFSSDIQMTLNDVAVDNDYEGSFENKRVMTSTMSFTLKGYAFPPIEQQKVIKYANTNLYTVPTANTDADITDAQVSTVSSANTFDLNTFIYPGLTANGEPTSNSAASIAVNLIDKDDNYGYIIEFTESI